jgi:hypothetical protein
MIQIQINVNPLINILIIVFNRKMEFVKYVQVDLFYQKIDVVKKDHFGMILNAKNFFLSLKIVNYLKLFVLSVSIIII